jgi:hypothetical protein
VWHRHVGAVASYDYFIAQFVEVPLCMMARRATALLEPEVKQLRPLTMDEEMQVCETKENILGGICTCSE